MGIKELFLAIKDVLVVLSKFINAIVNFVLLIPVFFIGIGLTSLISKLFGKSFMDVRLSNKKSYWVKKSLSTQNVEKYYRMF